MDFTYLKRGLGSNWFVISIFAVSLWITVISLSFSEQRKINKNTSDVIYNENVFSEPQTWFGVLACGTLITGIFTFIDFYLMFFSESYLKGDFILKTTFIQVWLGALMTFLGVSLWISDTTKEVKNNPTIIVILQSLANSIQLANIFNNFSISSKINF